MKITELHIKGFGCLNQERIVLRKGLNVIYGPNESGKTTLHTFIKSMLFGIRRQRGRAARSDDYSRYVPWDNEGNFAGSMKFVCGDRQFRLERNFQKDRANAFLICETDGERMSIGDGDLKMLLGGISESVYENTVSIGQLRAAAGNELAMELKNYMANYQDSGDGELDLERALGVLKKQKKDMIGELRRQQSDQEQREKSLLEQLKREERELALLGEKRKAQEESLSWQQAKQPEEGKETVKTASFSYGLAAAVIFLAAAGALAFLEGWIRLLLLGLGFLAEAALWYGKTKERQRMSCIQKRESQQKEAYNRERERLHFLIEHQREEEEEKRRGLLNLQKEYQDYIQQAVGDQSLKIRLEALNLAQETIESIAKEMQGRIGNRLQQRTSQIFGELTLGKYKSVFMDDTLTLSADTGDYHVPIEQLSRGAMEQLYFALRLAAAEILCQEEPLPIVLDDVFAMYDDRRLSQALIWLAKSGHQVLLCTCHTRERALLKTLNLPHHVVTLGL